MTSEGQGKDSIPTNIVIDVSSLKKLPDIIYAVDTISILYQK